MTREVSEETTKQMCLSREVIAFFVEVLIETQCYLPQTASLTHVMHEEFGGIRLVGYVTNECFQRPYSVVLV